MTHKFVVNTERVNEYGYRIITEGIDTEQYKRNPVVLYGHVRAFSDPKRIVGRCVKLSVEGTDLIAEIEFDTADELGKEVAGKVERGYLKMASLYADVKETSTEEEMLLPGQTLETVTKCKLVEISIVDVGGNDDALKLSRNGQPAKLQKITKPKKENMSLKTIALAMGLQEDADSASILKQYNDTTVKLNKAEKKANDLDKELKEIKGAEADTLVDKAVALGLIPEALKSTVRDAFDTDFKGKKVELSKLIEDKEAEDDQDGKHNALKEVVLGNGTAGKKTVELSFDYLQKHNPTKLREIRDNQPEEYARLCKEYGAGKRYKE